MPNKILCPKCDRDFSDLPKSGCYITCGCGVSYIFNNGKLTEERYKKYKNILKDEKMTYDSPFDIKNEKKKINEMAKQISDTKVRKAFAERNMKELESHADMLRKMSKFVNSKNKNGMSPKGFND
jgi:hypothetical protein